MKNLTTLLPSLALCFFLLSCTDTISVSTSDNYERIELPDGSTAYLNHHSHLSYEPAFANRTIEISGELYFEVQPDTIPFIIHTQLGDIKVIGTAFNVQSASEELVVEVEKGTVEVTLTAHHITQEVKKGSRAAYREGEKAFQETNAEFKFKTWLKALRKELKKAAKEIKKESKETKKDIKKFEKELKKESKKMKNAFD